MRRGRPAPHRAPPADALPRRARRRPRRGARAARRRARERARRSRSACSATPPRCCPSSLRRGVAGRRRHRPDERARSAERLRAGRADGRAGRGAARSRPRRVPAPRRRVGPHPRRRDPRAAGRRAPRRSTTATRCAASPQSHGDEDAFAYPGFVPAYIRPLFCEGKGPFRWVALSGDPADIHATDEAILDLFGDQEHIARWIALAQERVAFQGLPARICWLGYGERHLAGLRFNEMVASGELQGAGRHRPRPPRRGLGRLARARDRGDGRRHRRGRRLAAAQRAREHRVRRVVGVDPPRRRRRDGQVDPRRPGRASPTARTARPSASAAY